MKAIFSVAVLSKEPRKVHVTLHFIMTLACVSKPAKCHHKRQATCAFLGFCHILYLPWLLYLVKPNGNNLNCCCAVQWVKESTCHFAFSYDTFLVYAKQASAILCICLGCSGIAILDGEKLIFSCIAQGAKEIKYCSHFYDTLLMQANQTFDTLLTYLPWLLDLVKLNRNNLNYCCAVQGAKESTCHTAFYIDTGLCK